MDISDKTKIPLFAVIVTIPVLAGFIFWLTAMYANTAEATRVNLKQDEKIDAQIVILMDIRDRLIRIESKQK